MRGGRNPEGYADPTATIAVGRAARMQAEVENQEAEKRVGDLMKTLKYIIRLAGFELAERVQIKDTRTGRVYK